MKKFLWVALVLALASPATAQQLADSPYGSLFYVNGELMNKSKVNDPVAYRGSAPSGQRSLVKFSGDILDWGSNSRDEVVLIQFKQTEDWQRGGELYLGLKRPGMGSTDDAMVDALVATVNGGFRFKLPVIFEAGTNAGSAGNAGAWPGCMASGTPDNPYKWQFCQQGTDGNVVSYEVVQGVACARWAAYQGIIPKHTSPVAACRQ